MKKLIDIYVVMLLSLAIFGSLNAETMRTETDVKSKLCDNGLRNDSIIHTIEGRVADVNKKDSLLIIQKSSSTYDTIKVPQSCEILFKNGYPARLENLTNIGTVTVQYQIIDCKRIATKIRQLSPKGM